MGGIHFYLVLNGVGGMLGVLFMLNAVSALVLAMAIVVLRQRLLLVASVLSVLFMVGTLLALVLALTIGLLGIRETLDFQLVSTTLVVESIGTIVLVVTTALVFQMRRGAGGNRVGCRRSGARTALGRGEVGRRRRRPPLHLALGAVAADEIRKANGILKIG
jgi:hypothetical protein